MQIKILSQSQNIHPPFFELIHPLWPMVDPLNENENPDGGVKVDVRDGKPIIETKTVKVEVSKPAPKKSFLKVVK